MTYDPDRHIEDLARREPPQGHVGRVLARSGPGAAAQAPPGVPWRWALPVAATVLVVTGVWWQSDRASRMVWFELPVEAPHWSGKGVDVPVLPPEAYWAMDAIDEFGRLRPPMSSSTRRDAAVGAQPSRPGIQADPALVAAWTPRPPTLAPIVLEDITPDPIGIEGLADIPPVEIEPLAIPPIEIAPLTGDER